MSIILVAITLATVKKSIFVSYDYGLLQYRICVFGIPMYTREYPIFATRRASSGPIHWELMISKGILGQDKIETSNAAVVASLKSTLQAIAVARYEVELFDSNGIVESAWTAAAAHDITKLQDLKSKIGQRQSR